MADKRLPHPQERAHKDFWLRNGRLNEFLTHARTVREPLEASYTDLEDRVRELIGTHGIDWKTISRYLGAAPPRPQRSYPITALCVVFARIARDRGKKCSAPAASLKWLLAVGAEVEALLELATAPAPSGHRIRKMGAGERQAAAPAQPSLTSEAAGPTVGSASEPTIPGRTLERRCAKHPRASIRDLRRFLEVIPGPQRSDDPEWPVFPLNAPRYPATPAREIHDEHHPYTLLVKDESWNPTGSHKDRWALEKLLQYRQEVQRAVDRFDASGIPVELRPRSMISSGGAAFALQSLLRLFGLPPLRAIMDRRRTESGIVRRLRSVGALVRLHDLDEDFLTSEDVLRLTHNLTGLEITTRDFAAPYHECFYDWLVCEVLLLEPTHIFMPYGTGDLFSNFLEVIANEHQAGKRDRRLKGMRLATLTGIHVLGATADNRQSVMDKLYAAFRPTFEDVRARVGELIGKRVLGRNSGIYYVDDNEAIQARDTARDWGVCTEYSGIAGLALLNMLQPMLRLQPTDRVVIVNTGLLHTID